ncbi:zinc-binding dehydrogenase [Embleya sp. NBC_00888]|uniref:zinc-binding dehydrogenase n=1 Tax=Embleya sp. NBC_00888 TaxID=2975960 RepID=UPI0038650381|nr:zinc-binding dehydrogenase [Embleya sp. NBC_00888]
MNTRDHAVVFHEHGGPEVLKIEPAVDRPLRSGEVRFAVSAFALNRGDLMFLRGEYYTIPELPSRLGSEAAGIVTAVAPDVTDFRVGDRVGSLPFFTVHHGVQGTTATVPADYLAPTPEFLDDIEACSIWMQYLTAYFAFQGASRVEEGDTVLVTAAASSAGLGALQVASLLGARTVATTRSTAKAELLRAAGATAVVHPGSRSLAATIHEVSGGRGVAVAFDSLGGDSLNDYAEHLAPGATVLGLGMLSGRLPTIPMAEMCRAEAVFRPFSLFNHMARADERRTGVEFVQKAVHAGLRPRIGATFAFPDLVAAYYAMESNRHVGKIVVRCPAGEC